MAQTFRYGAHPSQFCHVYVPQAPCTGSAPVAVVLHGGYWRAKYDLSLMDGLCAFLASRGWIAWNVEYRRVGDTDTPIAWPAMFEDVAAAIDSLKVCAMAATFSGAAGAPAPGVTREDAPAPVDWRGVIPDVSRVVTVGHSAGGHLALWAAQRQGLPCDAPGATPVVAVAGVVALAPAADLDDVFARALSDTAVHGLLGGSPADVPGRYDVASPARRLPLPCPVLLLHGDMDDDLPVECSRGFVAKVAAVGGGSGDNSLEYVELPGGDHFVVIDPAHDCWRLAMAWMDGRWRMDA